MSSSDTYRHRVEQARDKIANFQKKRAEHAKKAADLQTKIANATKAAQSTRNSSTIQSKLREIESKTKELAAVEAKAADVEKKISEQHRKLNSAEHALAEAQKREAKSLADAQKREAKSRQRQWNKHVNEVDRRFAVQAKNHKIAMTEIEKLKQLPEVIHVLFLAANPLDHAELRLDEEVRSIEETIRKSRHRDVVHLHSRWAIRPPDVLQAINEIRPTVVHFAGHGSEDEEIIFQNDNGNAKAVSKAAIVQVMMACCDCIRLVFFNTGYSRGQAEAVVEHVEAAIGMNTSVGDLAARTFAAQFYSGVGFGRSLESAFHQAKALLMMEAIPEEETPELFVAESLSPADIVLVRPEMA